jgi:hypothetical protein
MTQRLKRWESPRRQGRNDKGRGGAARQRQLKKQQQLLRKKLKENNPNPNLDKRQNSKEGRETNLFPLIFWSYREVIASSLLIGTFPNATSSPE